MARSKSGQWHLIDRTGAEIGLLPDISATGPPAEGAFPIEWKGKWGFLDGNGNKMLEPRFGAAGARFVGSDLMRFTGGQAAVLAPIASHAGSHALGLIDTKGKWIIDAEPFYIGYGEGSLVTDCRDIPEPGEPPWGFDFRPFGVLRGPEIRIPFSNADQVRAARGGLIPFAKTECLDRNLIDYMPPEELEAHKLRWGLLGYDGRIVTSPTHDEIQYPAGGFCAVQSGGLWGFISLAEKPGIEARYREVKPFSNGLSAVSDDSGKWGFIDEKGDWAVQPEFEEVGPFVKLTN